MLVRQTKYAGGFWVLSTCILARIPSLPCFLTFGLLSWGLLCFGIFSLPGSFACLTFFENKPWTLCIWSAIWSFPAKPLTEPKRITFNNKKKNNSWEINGQTDLRLWMSLHCNAFSWPGAAQPPLQWYVPLWVHWGSVGQWTCGAPLVLYRPLVSKSYSISNQTIRPHEGTWVQ